MHRAPGRPARFLSTPSARRATSGCWEGQSDETFLSTPSARRATRDSFTELDNGGFLSTPSARRATQRGGLYLNDKGISIHALREESDVPGQHTGNSRTEFLSTPSARRATRKTHNRRQSPHNFYPRPPRGERQRPRSWLPAFWRFLSTPSARRATPGELYGA